MAKKFIGMWRLVSWTSRFADGTAKQYPTAGYIIYTDTSRMCTVIMNPNRPKWKSETAPTPDEALSAIGTTTDLTAYCATVEVHAKEGFVLHHVDIEKRPNFVGRTRKRWFTFEASNRVSLRFDPSELAPGQIEQTLIWERVQ